MENDNIYYICLWLLLLGSFLSEKMGVILSNDLTNEMTPFRPYKISVKCNMQGEIINIHRFVTQNTCRRITQLILSDEELRSEYRDNGE